MNKQNLSDLQLLDILQNSDADISEEEFGYHDSDADPAYQPGLSSSSDEEYEEIIPRHARNANNVITAQDEVNVVAEEEPVAEEHVPQQPVAENYTWGPVGEQNELNNFDFNPEGEQLEVNPDILQTMMDCEPVDFLELFVTNSIINHLVVETNRYANQRKNVEHVSPYARITKWVDTNESEMKCFLAIVMHMGLNTLPSIAHYWRTVGKYRSILPMYMSRNRFELLLAHLHCANNDEAPPGDRLHKIQQLVDKIVNNFKMAVIPESLMCIDESIIPFRGRVVFRQYLKNKSHPYGIKVFKLCVKDCYTLSYKIYSGKQATRAQNVSSDIVHELISPYMNIGRTLFVDNWYTYVQLADSLLEKKTHLVGTLRKNRKFNPSAVVDKKLKKGEIVAQKNNKNIVVLKWKDRRDVLLLSTKHVDTMTAVMRNGTEVRKPEAVVHYNQGKGFIDLSDQMSAYHSGCLRRSVKWFRKVAFDLLLNTAVVNAWSLYKTCTKKQDKITAFKEAIIDSWMDNWLKVRKTNLEPEIEVSATHSLIKTTRGRCKSCYKRIVKEFGRAHAILKTKKVNDKCNNCHERMCIDCFFSNHASKVKC